MIRELLFAKGSNPQERRDEKKETHFVEKRDYRNTNAIKKSKPAWITDNIIRSLKGTSYIRYSTSKHPTLDAGVRKVIFKKRKAK